MSFAQKNAFKRLFLEGNVGAGKSTFLKIIEKALNLQVIYEPHTKWQQVGTSENILDKFYTDMPRWAYTFQTYAFVTRVVEQEVYAKKSNHAVHVVERSVYADRYCFAKNCYEMGVMNALEWKLYQEWFGWLVENYTTKPAGFIYLRTDPQVCYERLVKRNRAEEATVSLEYLTMLHDRHEQWLIHKKEVSYHLEDVPVLVLDCNQDFQEDPQEQERHMQKIIEFFGLYRQPGMGTDSVQHAQR